jgi:hypothetical protein
MKATGNRLNQGVSFNRATATLAGRFGRLGLALPAAVR